MKGRFIVPCRVASVSDDAAGNALGTFALYNVPGFPARCSFYVLIGLEADSGDAGQFIELGLEVRSPDWHLLYFRPLCVRPGPLGQHGEAWVCYCASAVAFTARSAGDHEVRCCLGDSVLARAGLSIGS